MSRAEERALEAYPVIWSSDDEETRWDIMESHRMDFRLGYEHAEKDLALTVEDIKTILDIAAWVLPKEMKPSEEEEYYAKVLNEYNRIVKQESKRASYEEDSIMG